MTLKSDKIDSRKRRLHSIQSTKHLSIDSFFLILLDFFVFFELGKQSIEITDTILIFTTLLDSKADISSSLIPIFQTFVRTCSPVNDLDIRINGLLEVHITPRESQFVFIDIESS